MIGQVGIKLMCMTLFHAVAFVDHQSAQVLQFGSGPAQERRIHAHLHYTRKHGSGARAEQAFFGEVCDALDGVAEVLITGGHKGLADFRHYVEKHRPPTAARIVGYAVVDHPTENQLVALARKHFANYDRMVGTPLPT